MAKASQAADVNQQFTTRRSIPSRAVRIKKDLRKNYLVYLIALPVVVWFLIFCYGPMWGIGISFVDFKPARGMLSSPFMGLYYYRSFIRDPLALRAVVNTFALNIWGLVFGFPAPIILAIMLNEVKAKTYKRVLQTVSYMPHFISIVVVCGMINIFSSTDGLFNTVYAAVGGEPFPMLQRSTLFRPIYTFSGIWQGMGFGSIIYLAAIAGIAPELYESAELDGASRLKQIWHITIPVIMPTITIMFILAVGGMLASNFEKVILLYNSLTMDRADVIGSFVYRRGLRENNPSYATAVGTLNSIANFAFLWVANRLAARHSETSLW